MWAPVVERIDRINRANPWSHNDHYRGWVLRQVPGGATRALDVGCGTGNLAYALSRVVDEVDGIDRDPRVIAVARARRASGTGGTGGTVHFATRDLLAVPAEPGYDVVTAVAVLHHLPMAAALQRMRSLLRPGGRLVVVGCYRQDGPADRAIDLLAVPANLVLGRLKRRQADAARITMSAPTADPAATLREVRATAARVLPGARVRRRLFWRYTLVHTRPDR
jgi:2-polyprenyl-3-methyl-5-hydroxy-6-metoxy-1,4-benzoquinol methylase